MGVKPELEVVKKPTEVIIEGDWKKSDIIAIKKRLKELGISWRIENE